MDKNDPPKFDRGDPMWDVAHAIENSVRAIRKARGKRNPEDCIQGAPDHEEVLNEFLEDVLAAIGDEEDEDEDEADSFGAGATG